VTCEGCGLVLGEDVDVCNRCGFCVECCECDEDEGDDDADVPL